MVYKTQDILPQKIQFLSKWIQNYFNLCTVTKLFINKHLFLFLCETLGFNKFVLKTLITFKNSLLTQTRLTEMTISGNYKIN